MDDRGANLGLRGEKPAANRLSHGTALRTTLVNCEYLKGDCSELFEGIAEGFASRDRSTVSVRRCVLCVNALFGIISSV
jgi:hypothetical protein